VSTRLPVYLFTCLHVYMFTCLPNYLSTSLPVFLSTHLPVYLLCIYLSTCLPVYLSTYLPITRLPVYQCLLYTLCRTGLMEWWGGRDTHYTPLNRKHFQNLGLVQKNSDLRNTKIILIKMICLCDLYPGLHSIQ